MKYRVASLLVLAFAAIALHAGFVNAEPQTADQLKAVEKDLQNTKAEKELLQKESVTVARDISRAEQTKIALAKDIQDQEYSILLLENRISALEAEADRRGAALVRRDKQMGQALMALERLALHPGDALTLTPLSPDDAVRSAILLRAAVPQIASSTAALQAELADLYRARTEIVSQKEQVAAAAAAMAAKRTQLDALIEAKTARQASVTARSASVETRMTALAQQAEDLRALFAKLAEDKARRQEAARQARQANAAKRTESKPPVHLVPPPGVAPVVPSDETQTASATPPPDRTAPSSADDNDNDDDVDTPGSGRLFSKARGTLPFPAVGKVTSKYGETGSGGQLTKGITIATHTGATVVTPYDGRVAFAGQFRGYGLLLIIEHSEGYHTLMAGMARIDSSVGQRVLAGEPVGVMPEEGEPSLYVELRRDGQPINPLPWLAVRTGPEAAR